MQQAGCSQTFKVNTQTHLLLACAVLIPAASSYRASNVVGGIEVVDGVEVAGVSEPRTLLLTIAAITGALLPDVSIFVMWGIAKSQGVAESIIWSDWYYSSFWQSMGAITNSFPLYLMLAVGAWWAGARFSPGGGRWVKFILVFASAAILHVVADFPLHHDDGHPHFWPFTQWIFSSPVSYWDPRHYGRIWSWIELLIALLLIAIIWRRFRSRISKVVLVLVALSYIAATAYWLTAF